MRIGYVAPSLDDTTGWGRWVNDFLAHVTSEGVEPFLWAPASAARHRSGAPGAIPAAFVLPELFDSLRSLAGVRAARALPRFLGTMEPGRSLDAVHSLEAYPWCLYGHLLAARHGVPHFITCHGRYGYIPSRRVWDRLPYERVLRSCARFIAVSDAVRRRVLHDFGDALDEDRSTVLWNAIDAGRLTEGDGSAGQDDSRGGPPTIISVTRFVRVKGVHTAIDAFALVRQRVPDARYLIVGPGNHDGNRYFAEMAGMIRDRGLEGITIAGRLDKVELARQYRGADVLLHTPVTLPDDFEAYGLILLEAGVFGLPVVATRSGGHEEVVSDGQNGFLVPEGDAGAAAEALVALLNDRPRARAMGQQNRAVAMARNWKWFVREQRKMYARPPC